MTDAERASSMATSASQDAIIEFLMRDGVVDDGVPHHIETHIAHVFVGPRRALKIKRAISLPYLDLSTLERRRAVCLRELEINQASVPDLYLGVVPIVARENGALALGGPGTPIDWAVEMRAFPQSALLSAHAAKGTLTPALLKSAADEVLAMHRRASPVKVADPVHQMSSIVADVANAIDAAAPVEFRADVADWRKGARAQIAQQESLLRLRATQGNVRRCHGDLHLANIVVWQGRPVPFDAIEFSEEIATIDTFYDLAFLLMDAEHRAGRAAANVILNRYLWAAGDNASLDALALLPLYLSARAAIRAMVAAERAILTTRKSDDKVSRAGDETTFALYSAARAYLDKANAYLQRATPCLVAVGGLSGTGKSTLSMRLAPQIGASPGAVHLRSDLERKHLAGAQEMQRLSPAAYSPEQTALVYERLISRAETALAAGHGVVVDAVFSKDDEREAAERVARKCGVPFYGLWLEAPPEAMKDRVAHRTGDASDATPAVVEAQLARGAGRVTWHPIAAGGDACDTLGQARRALAPVLNSTVER